MKKNFSPQFLIVTIMILLAAFSRLLTNKFEIWNFTPIIAMALFSGAEIRDKRLAFVIPLIAMLITDVFLGFYPGIAVVYGALMLITCLGFLLQNRVNVVTVILGSLGSSVIFFLVTNFALVYPTVMYPHNLQGVIESYAQALKFYRDNNFSALYGDLIYSGILFGSYELIFKKVLTPVKAV
ncbi:MAG TPA: DUF6580 family putative transport protein [Chitinophagales bacterium]|nr:DUF6580 family putative transport protein [Chitinophagales bacterium]